MRFILVNVRPVEIPDDLDAIPVDEVARLAVAYVLTSRALLDLAVQAAGKPAPN